MRAEAPSFPTGMRGLYFFCFPLDSADGTMIYCVPMRKERQMNGKVASVYEPGDGIRKRYRESLDPSRFTYPRRGLIHHPRAWYLSDAPKVRPVFGVYALAAFAEDMLWRSKHAKKGKAPRYEDAVRYFAETRRALQNVLSTYRINRQLTAAQVRSLRKTVERLVGSARELIEKLDKSYLTRDVKM